MVNVKSESEDVFDEKLEEKTFPTVNNDPLALPSPFEIYCNKCESTFPTFTSLKKHSCCVQNKKSQKSTFSPSKAAKKPKTEKDFACDQCEKVFSRNQHLQAHIAAIHEENSRFECKECKKRFTISHNLKRHMESVHEKLRKYQCC